ncbi:B12-binding domain-containing radical SAM protein [Candidatus Thiosymbion oneisti]|uniref:B12-binding domain-containing radical SAM protein n=1 Tax=Candidatus Thiosymbion oneisti TaxID=589554 RepID=UPI0013FDEB8D|nr:radical SAM protein [Candidatus Thiosymbion oneisti]
MEPPLGLLYLASVIRESGNYVCLIDLAGIRNPDSASELPNGFDLYGFSTYSVTYHTSLGLALAVKQRNPRAIIVAGGPHATALPERVSEDGFDVVITGEGEVAIEQLLQILQDGQRPPRIMATPHPEPLDDLPIPAYELVDLASYHRRVSGEPSLSVLSSRGCPFPCTFCNSNIMGRARRVRYRSAESVAAEIRYLKSRYGIEHFRFQDDLFTSNPGRIAELTPLLQAEGIVYRCFARVTGFTPEIARMLANSGCRHVSFGVESGSPSILGRHAMNKRQNPEQIRRALNNAARAGLMSRIYLIVGFPGETEQTIAETLALVKDCPWDEFMVYPLIAYPGTPIHDNPERFGIVTIDHDYSQYLQIGRERRAGFTIRTRHFGPDQVRTWRDRVINELIADGRTWAGLSKDFK